MDPSSGGSCSRNTADGTNNAPATTYVPSFPLGAPAQQKIFFSSSGGKVCSNKSYIVYLHLVGRGDRQSVGHTVVENEWWWTAFSFYSLTLGCSLTGTRTRTVSLMGLSR